MDRNRADALQQRRKRERKNNEVDDDDDDNGDDDGDDDGDVRRQTDDGLDSCRANDRPDMSDATPGSRPRLHSEAPGTQTAERKEERKKEERAKERKKEEGRAKEGEHKENKKRNQKIMVRMSIWRESI